MTRYEKKITDYIPNGQTGQMAGLLFHSSLKDVSEDAMMMIIMVVVIRVC